MKKTMTFLAIFALAVVLSLTVFADKKKDKHEDEACEHSHGPEHASDNGKNHASDNSVLNRCVPATCSDGTLEGSCSQVNPGFSCQNGQLIADPFGCSG